MRRGLVRAWLAWWVLCAALWLALVDRVALDELILGVPVAALGASAAVVVRGQRTVLLQPRAAWLTRAWRPLFALVRDVPALVRVVVVRGVLRREGSGTIHALPFEAGGDEPRAAARRVLTAALGSLGPNTIVLDIDDDVLYAHRLSPAGDVQRDTLPLS